MSVLRPIATFARYFTHWCPGVRGRPSAPRPLGSRMEFGRALASTPTIEPEHLDWILESLDRRSEKRLGAGWSGFGAAGDKCVRYRDELARQVLRTQCDTPSEVEFAALTVAHELLTAAASGQPVATGAVSLELTTIARAPAACLDPLAYLLWQGLMFLLPAPPQGSVADALAMRAGESRPVDTPLSVLGEQSRAEVEQLLAFARGAPAGEPLRRTAAPVAQGSWPAKRQGELEDRLAIESPLLAAGLHDLLVAWVRQRTPIDALRPEVSAWSHGALLLCHDLAASRGALSTVESYWRALAPTPAAGDLFVLWRVVARSEAGVTVNAPDVLRRLVDLNPLLRLQRADLGLGDSKPWLNLHVALDPPTGHPAAEECVADHLRAFMGCELVARARRAATSPDEVIRFLHVAVEASRVGGALLACEVLAGMIDEPFSELDILGREAVDSDLPPWLTSARAIGLLALLGERAALPSAPSSDCREARLRTIWTNISRRLVAGLWDRPWPIGARSALEQLLLRLSQEALRRDHGHTRVLRTGRREFDEAIELGAWVFARLARQVSIDTNSDTLPLTLMWAMDNETLTSGLCARRLLQDPVAGRFDPAGVRGWCARDRRLRS